MDDQAYLEPDFDPSSLTVPKLRSILVQHNVNYPSSAKKTQLVDLFNENVLPQARKIRSANARVKRTSRGIVDVPPSQSTTNGDEEEEEEVRPAPRSTSRRSGGRTSRARTEEAQEVQPTPRASRHSTAPPEATPRQASSKHARVVDKAVPEEEPQPKRPASGKSRLSAATPIVKQDPAEDGSPFSNENFFQSGSSPPAPTDRRRSAQSAAKEVERRKSREVRRRTDDVKPARQQMDGAVVPTRKTLQMPAPATKRQEFEPSEEFTPEEQLELVKAQEANELVPARPRTKRPASNTARIGVGSVVTALLTGMAALWSQEKFNVGYCGVGQPSTEIAGVQIPESLDLIRPQCEPCPPHAICTDNLHTSCEPGFVLIRHPLSLGGVLPVPPSCEPDSAKARKIEAVKGRAIEELREQNAKYECGQANSPEVKETKLKEMISSQRRKGMSNEEFEDLWEWASQEVVKADEVSTGTDG